MLRNEEICFDTKQKQEIKSQLPLLQEQGILDQETSQLRHYHLEIEISQLKAKLAGLPPVNLKAIADTVSIAEFWLDLSETERRFYFREFIQKIELIRLDRQYWKIRLVFIF